MASVEDVEVRLKYEVEHSFDAQVGKTGGVIMAALLLEGGVDYLTPAIARKCREAALICYGVEDDVPGEE